MCEIKYFYYSCEKKQFIFSPYLTIIPRRQLSVNNFIKFLPDFCIKPPLDFVKKLSNTEFSFVANLVFIYLFILGFLNCRLPSLVPHRQFHMDRYSVNNPVYTKIYQGINRPFVELSTNYKTRKLDFWNYKIPMYSGKLDSGDVIQSPVQRTHTVTGPDHWALIATSIGLAGLAMFLAVGYCKTKIQLQNLHRQHGVCIAGEISSKDIKKSKYFKTNVWVTSTP